MKPLKMEYIFTLNGEEITITTEHWTMSLRGFFISWKCQELYKIYDKNNYHIKVKVCCWDDDYVDENFSNEIKYYKLISSINNNLCPKLINYGYENIKTKMKIYFENDVQEDDDLFCVSYIITKKFGVSLLDKFFQDIEKHKYKGPEFSMENLLWINGFNEYFCNDRIPEKIRMNVLNILYILIDNNIYHRDVHSGNFLIEDSQIKIIDFEHCCSKEE